MPFQYVLANLLSDIPTASAVAFLDEEGETVSLISSQQSHDDVRIFGAYQGIFLNHLSRILKDRVDFFSYRTESMCCYNLCVGKEYLMVLQTETFQPIEFVRRQMEKAKKEIEEHAL
ncbi:MAG TPA: hypothetical protein PK014_10205 [Thermoanaerobaculia bacterium]|nr:hypothetical protein [Thermoanaerobaculia bacterium]HUM30491.1 hypothetical protein [Thermoanaerobaculia bacterium]HXK68642.1 hypothetical protein [Thermoanaerobaculia bacterium]